MHLGIDTSNVLVAPEYLAVEWVFVGIAQASRELEFLEVHCHRGAIAGSKLEVDRGDLRRYELDCR